MSPKIRLDNPKQEKMSILFDNEQECLNNHSGAFS